MTRAARMTLIIIAVLLQVESALAFSSTSLPCGHVASTSTSRRSTNDDDSSGGDDASEEAARLLARAKAIRESIPRSTSAVAEDADAASADTADTSTSKRHPSVGYRLYVDIGRESGTWMEPRWGASGNRIEFTIDVEFLTPSVNGVSGVDTSLADEEIVVRMVKDNFGGKSSPVRFLTSSESARLRGGFDKMTCCGGGYRIDVGGANGQSVVRFFIETEGTPATGSSYGDISVPKGPLYFSIPCFGNSVTNLSIKESPVTVRQIGWHTGWRREESRIVGTFRAKKIEEARIIDKY
mmetsp:Transcript_3629/g.8244  ORF Transcript_3629/g.8244 Transcript_3629/m.8244 type:complete len:296 (+) Transcript_3629:156-1043(+)